MISIGNLSQKIHEMFERTSSYPNSINKNILYYFKKPHVFSMKIEEDKFSLPTLHTIIYNPDDIFLAIANNYKVSENPDNVSQFIELTSEGEDFLLGDIKFSRHNFKTYSNQIIEKLMRADLLLTFYHSDTMQHFSFRIKYNNKSCILVINNEDFEVKELPIFDENFSTYSIVNEKMYTFSRKIDDQETEYIFYYLVPHLPHKCHDYLNEIKMQEPTEEKPVENNFNVNKMNYIFLIYRLNNGMISKMHAEFHDCPDIPGKID